MIGETQKNLPAAPVIVERPVKGGDFIDFLEVDQEMARAMYVGRYFKRFKRNFDIFDTTRGFHFSFVWPPLLVGGFWFIYRRMYFECAMFMLLGLLLAISEQFDPLEHKIALLVVMHLVMAFSASWLYCLAVDRKIETALKKVPAARPAAVLGWLKRERGAGLWRVLWSLFLFAALYQIHLMIVSGELFRLKDYIISKLY